MRENGGSDGDVVRAVLAGDVDRYAELIVRYRDRYARYAARMLGSMDEADDAVQDAFIRAYEQLAQCRDPANFAGWFFLILRNRCFAERRSAGRLGARTSLEAEPVAAPDDASRRLENEELRQRLQRELMELTPEQREVFILKHVEELSYEEIAARIGGSVAALKMRMHRAYDRLRERLTREEART